MHKIILFNGMMTSFGLIADLVGVYDCSSINIAVTGLVLGITDTISFIYIMRSKSNRKKRHKSKLNWLSKLKTAFFL